MNNLKTQIEKINFVNYIPLDRNEFIYFYDFFTNTVETVKYKNLDNDIFHSCKTREDAKNYGEMFILLLDMVGSELLKSASNISANLAYIDDVFPSTPSYEEIGVNNVKKNDYGIEEARKEWAWRFENLLES